jgi:hypothetical protein
MNHIQQHNALMDRRDSLKKETIDSITQKVCESPTRQLFFVDPPSMTDDLNDDGMILALYMKETDGVEELTVLCVRDANTFDMDLDDVSLDEILNLYTDLIILKTVELDPEGED